MSGRQSSELADHLRLADSLLIAVGDTLSSLQRLLREVHKEIECARREEEQSTREDEVRALRREVDQLREGMASRAVIERAKGILMESHDLSESQAFELLNEMSQRRHRKLRDVAADVANGSLSPRLTTVRPHTGTAPVPDRPVLVPESAAPPATSTAGT